MILWPQAFTEQGKCTPPSASLFSPLGQAAVERVLEP